MDWAELVKFYVEIGILGLCGVLTVMIAYLGFKRSQDDNKKKDKRLEKIKINQMIGLILC